MPDEDLIIDPPPEPVAPVPLTQREGLDVVQTRLRAETDARSKRKMKGGRL